MTDKDKQALDIETIKLKGSIEALKKAIHREVYSITNSIFCVDMVHGGKLNCLGQKLDLAEKSIATIRELLAALQEIEPGNK